jgi:hypothetical protein
MAQVSEVAIWPDRLEFLAAGQAVTFRLADLARWPRPASMWRLLFRVGCRPGWLPVGERDWFHPPQGRFIRFYTKPPVTVYMPVDEPVVHSESYFLRVQLTLAAGGFHTIDLG